MYPGIDSLRTASASKHATAKVKLRRSRNSPMCELQVRKYLAVAYTAAVEHWMVVQKTTGRV